MKFDMTSADWFGILFRFDRLITRNGFFIFFFSHVMPRCHFHPFRLHGFPSFVPSSGLGRAVLRLGEGPFMTFRTPHNVSDRWNKRKSADMTEWLNVTAIFSPSSYLATVSVYPLPCRVGSFGSLPFFYPWNGCLKFVSYLLHINQNVSKWQPVRNAGDTHVHENPMPPVWYNCKRCQSPRILFSLFHAIYSHSFLLGFVCQWIETKDVGEWNRFDSYRIGLQRNVTVGSVRTPVTWFIHWCSFT